MLGLIVASGDKASRVTDKRDLINICMVNKDSKVKVVQIDWSQNVTNCHDPE